MITMPQGLRVSPHFALLLGAHHENDLSFGPQSKGAQAQRVLQNQNSEELPLHDLPAARTGGIPLIPWGTCGACFASA